MTTTNNNHPKSTLHWYNGILKVRGTNENICNFFYKAFISSHSRDDIFSYEFKPDTPSDQVDIIKCNSGASCDPFLSLPLTNWHLIEIDKVKFVPSLEDPDILIGGFSIYISYDIKTADLRKLSEEYDIDLRIYAYNETMQREKLIEVHKGKSIKNTTKTYKNKDYRWECNNPNML